MFKHGFPPYWSTLKKLIWLVGTGIVGGVTEIWKTVTGTLIHITDALASPMQKCEVTLEPIQDLHGQDAPYPAGGGKNYAYFDPADITGTGWLSFDSQTEKFTVMAGSGVAPSPIPLKRSIPSGTVVTTTVWIESGQYTTGTISVGAYHNESGNISWQGQNNLELNTNLANKEYSKTVTTTDDINALEIFIHGNPTVTTNIVFRVQIEIGSTSTNWSPNSNICPITGWTGCEVTRTGKNLYPYTTIPAYNYAWYSGSKALADATNPVFLKGGKKYAVSADQSVAATTSAIVRAWRADGTILENAPNVLNLKDPVSGTTATYQAAPKYYQLSTPNYAKPFTNIIEPTEDLWVDMRCSGDNIVGNDPMLQVGDSRTDYEPYSDTTLSVTFPDSAGTVYGGTVDLVSGVLTVKMASVDISTLDFSSYSTPGAHIFRTDSLKHIIKAPNGNTDYANAKCSSFWQKLYQPLTANDNGAFSVAPYSYSEVTGRVIFVDHRYSNVADFIAGNQGVQLVYELAEPTEISLTPQEISTLKGVNNVWSNSNGDTTIIYKAQAS